MVNTYIDNLIITSKFPKISQPSSIKTQLKDHQSSSIAKMIYMEENRNIKINEFCGRYNGILWESGWDYTIDRFNSGITNINLNCGILCNSVGSGKSLIILGLIANNKKVKLYQKNSIVGDNKGPYVSLTRDMSSPRVEIESNLIVVPHPIYNQWTKYINRETNLKTLYIKGKNELSILEKIVSDEILNNENIAGHYYMGYLALAIGLSKYDIVLVKSTLYNKFIDTILKVSNHLSNYIPIKSWSRLIYDEICNIELPNNRFIRANYTWFITSSINDLMSCNFKNNGFLKAVWKLMINFDTYYLKYDMNSLQIPRQIVSLDKKIYEKYITDQIKYNYFNNVLGPNYSNLEKKIPIYFLEKYYKDDKNAIES